MGAYTGEAKLAQTNAIARKTAPTISAEWATIASEVASFAPEASGAERKKIKLAGSAAKGFKTGEVIVFTEVNGTKIEPSGLNEGKSVAGIVLGRPYWIVGEEAGAFEIAYTKGGVGLSYTEELKATSLMVVVKEHTGAKTKRQKTVFAEATDATGGVAIDAAREIEASAAVNVKWIMYWSAEVAGTLCAINKVELRELKEGDIYKITSGELSENGVQ